LDKLILRRLSRRIWESAKWVVPNSKGLLDGALKTSTHANFKVIENGVDTDFFKPDPEMKIHDGSLRIISVGRLNPIKGFDLLIEAVKGLEDIKLVLVGDGPEKENLERLAIELQVDLELTGRLSQEEIIERLQIADIYVLSSYSEGMSNALMEGMACGLPVLSTRVGGAEELLEDNGLIVEPGALSELRDGVLYFKSINKKDLLGMSRRSVEIANNKSWITISQLYKEIYEKSTTSGQLPS
jgi:glycosyltransferase involved in cell wall biosynthesis